LTTKPPFADRDDDRVLDRLGLHQPEDLGAEVLPPVRPANAAPRDLAAPEVDPLHPRRVDEDLEHRPGRRQVGDAGRVELEGEVRLRPPVVAGLEVGRPQHRLDHAEEAAQDPVLVEARDLVEVSLELADERLGPRVRGPPPARLEAKAKELDQPAGDSGVRGQALLHVRLAEGAARLAQVLGDRAQQRDLAPGQPGAEDEPVEAVVLDVAVPGFGKGLLEDGAHAVGLVLDFLAVVEAEVVDPDRRAVERRDLVGPLVGHLHPHVLEQREDVREQDRRARAEQLERQVPGPGFEREVEAQVEVACGVEALDPVDVGDRGARREVLPIGGRERLAVPLEQPGAALLAQLRDERVLQVVAPGARDRDEPRLDLADVELRGRARRRVDDHVEANEHRLGDPRRVVDADAAEGVLEDLLDPLANVRVVALEREVDEAGDEPAERVPADEEPHAPALAEVEDAERDLVELVLADLEQLVARVGLEDLDERLVVVAGGNEAAAVEDPLHLPAQHRDLPGAGAVGGRGVEAEEAPLPDDVALLVEPLHADVVQIARPVHRRPRVRLRQVE
jgi:hypothetical protein